MEEKKVQKSKKQTTKNKQDNAYLKIIIAIILFVIALFLLSRSTNIVENVIVSYDTDSNIDYKVYLFENEYIPSEYMEEGKTYITNLVSKVNADFKYKIKTSKKFDSEYEYDIYANAVVAHNSSGKELWTQKVDLIKGIKVNVIDKDTINVAASAVLPYNQLNTKVKAFKNQHNIPIKAYVDLELVIRDSKTKKEVATTGLSMDLFEDVFEVTEVKTGKNVLDITENKKPNQILIIVESIIAIGSFVYAAYLIYTIINSNMVRKSYYAKAIYKILKNYGDIVAEVVKPVDLDNLKIIDVKNFDQMLDVEEELRIPIMFYETIKNEEGWFVLVHNDMAYRYILRDRLK